jgi:hypothetical protein
MLTQNDQANHPELSLAPPMKSKHGELGLMEILNDIPPLYIGKHMAKMLSNETVKNCRTFYDYIACLDVVNEHFHQNSQSAHLDKLRFDSTDKCTVALIRQTKFNSKNNNSHDNKSDISKTHNPNLNLLTRPTQNPRLFNVDDDNRYNMNRNDTPNPYRNNDYDMLNDSDNTTSMNHPLNNPNTDSNEHLLMLQKSNKPPGEMPCFAFFNNKSCVAKNCAYSHLTKDMSTEYMRRYNDLSRSPWKGAAEASRPQPSAIKNNRPPPTRSLSIIADEKEEVPSQVSFQDNSPIHSPTPFTYGDVYDVDSDSYDITNHMNI